MKKNLLYLLVLLLALYPSLRAQESKINWNQKIKNNPAVITGKLKNGINYYILKNSKPEKRAELRLAVNAGSVLEDDNQQGLAHFVEHMAFNGTKKFKKQEIVNFLEGIGMRFGPELNAGTGMDETTYMLQMPTDKKENLEKGFQILSEWAHNIAFEPEEIDKERGVIIEEWRLGRGAQGRITDKMIPVLLKNSKYASRLPIGKKEILESFKHETLKKFYKDWYRPDLMAVVAVGDFMVKDVENMIKKEFGVIPPVKNPRKRTEFDVPPHKETLYSIESDKELPMSTAIIYYKTKPYATLTYKDFKEDAMGAIFTGLIMERLEEIRLKPDAPFLFAQIAPGGGFVRSASASAVVVIPKDNNVEKGLKAVLIELERAKKFGFTETEIERQKKEYLRVLEERVKEKDKRESAELVDRIIENYLKGETYPNEETNFEIGRKVVPVITAGDITEFINRSFGDENRVVTVSMTEKEGVTKPAQEALAKILTEAGKEKIEAYVDKTISQELIPFEIKPGKIVSESKDEKMNITKLELSNGAIVYLKPTDFKNDEVLFSAYSKGGSSLYDEKFHRTVTMAPNYISQAGAGSFTQPDLKKYLTGKNAYVTPRISLYSEGMDGGASLKDLETMFRLNYLYFTNPRKDTSVFRSLYSMSENLLKYRSGSPENVFIDTVNVTLSNYHKRGIPLNLEGRKEINYDKAFEYYKERFANAGDFTFTFAGSFKIENIKPLIEKYIGGLPSTGQKEDFKDAGMRYPKGVILKEVKKGIEQKSSVQYYFTGDISWTREEAYLLESLTEVMNIKLREAIREDKGGTYGIQVVSSASKEPKGEYIIGISFGCQPQRAEELCSVIMSQIDSVANYPLKAEYVNKVRETQLKAFEKDSKENSSWIAWIGGALRYGISLEDFLPNENRIKALSAADIQSAAKKFFNKDNYLRVVLYPEK